MHEREPRPAACPCGSQLPLARCCGPFLAGSALAPTAEKLMRSRYTAFAVADAAYLLSTWHPDTRPGSLVLDDGLQWTRLDILASSAGSMFASTGTVEFRAHYREGRRQGSLHERSQFVRKGGQWLYLAAIKADISP